jgi:Big-like domain-containing protein
MRTQRLSVVAILGFFISVWACPSWAQTGLIGGGLTALPAQSAGPNLVVNGGFETLSAGRPTSWTASGTWAADQQTLHSGAFSFRYSTGGGTAQQNIQLKAGTYVLTAWLKTSALGSGSTSGVRLTLDFRPGGINAWWPSDVISGTNDWTQITVGPVVVDTDRLAGIELESYNGPAGTAWFDDVQLTQILPQSVDAFLLYPNFRGMLFDDGPSTIRVDVSVTPPGNDFTRYDVRTTLSDEATGAVLAQSQVASAAHLVATVDGAAMQAGRPYLVTVVLVDRSTSGVASTYPAYRVSKVPASARQSMNVSFDAKNRVLLHGVPRFVLGVYDSALSYSADPTFWETTLWSPTGDRRMTGLPINMYLNYWYGQAPLDAMSALMANLQAHGVMYLQTGNCFDKYPADATFNINSSDTYVQTLGSQAGSAGYYTADECLSGLVPGVFDQYRRLRSLDPDSVTFAALLGNPDITLWRDSADVISTDPYPLFGAQPAGGYALQQVADWTALARTTVKDARPFMTVLQFFKFTSQGRFPTRAEMRNMAYMAIVEGARGLWWWSLGDNALAAVCSGWCAEKIGYMDDLKAVVTEIAGMESVLLADDVPSALTGSSNTAIRTKVKVANGRAYLLASNYTNATQTATFTWAAAPGPVTVNAETRTLTPSGSTFTDSFGPYQAHVYVLNAPGSGGAPLAVSFSAPAAGATVSGTTTATLTASGGSGAGYSYRLAVDGTTLGTSTSGGFSWNTTALADGAHTLTATVTDSNAGTATASESVMVSNAAAPPPPPPPSTVSVFITQPTAGTAVSGTSWAVIWLQNAVGASNAVTLTMAGRTVGSGTSATLGPISVPYDTTLVANGSQTLTASVRDEMGNTGTSGGVGVTVSNGATAPPLVASITAPAAGATVSGATTVTMTASGGSGTGYTYTLALDGTTLFSGAATSYAWDTFSASNASHTLTLTVRDSAGTTASTTRTVTVANFVRAPSELAAMFVAPLNGTTVSGTVTVTMQASGGTAPYTYTLALDGVTLVSGASSSYAWNTTGVANGAHTLSVTVRDAAGALASASETVQVSNGKGASKRKPKLSTN